MQLSSYFSTFSIIKHLGKIAYNQLYKYLETNKILSDNQFGVRSEKSTANAILNQLYYLYKHLEGGESVFSMAFGFQEGF